jgi:SAM-dependent methyltransferase
VNCRFCNNPLHYKFIDLVSSPPSNSFLRAEQLSKPETFFPLQIYVCNNCWLVQLDEYKQASEIFTDDYVYFSSFSKSWLRHAEQYVEMMIQRFEYNSSSSILEIASNDGYLLQYFHQRGIPVLGVEPTANTADAARAKGIHTLGEFFGEPFARKLVSAERKPNLILGNNVLAHVPDINDFVSGIAVALAEHGVVTMEFPHLAQLIRHHQFDTIYHEHFSYLSLTTVRRIFAHHALTIFDVEEIPTHGGSLRIFAKHTADGTKHIAERVEQLIESEKAEGLETIAYYQNFQDVANKVKYDFLDFLIQQKRKGKKVVGYGAAAKGNTLMNYCGIKTDLLLFVADASPHKQGKYLPGTHIPVVAPEQISVEKPDFVVILPWNIQEEVSQQLEDIYTWGGKFAVAIPSLRIF